MFRGYKNKAANKQNTKKHLESDEKQKNILVRLRKINIFGVSKMKGCIGRRRSKEQKLPSE